MFDVLVKQKSEGAGRNLHLPNIFTKLTFLQELLTAKGREKQGGVARIVLLLIILIVAPCVRPEVSHGDREVFESKSIEAKAPNREKF